MPVTVESTPAVTTGPQVLTMVAMVTAGAVLIAGLNANTAVRSAQVSPLPCACQAWAALVAHRCTPGLTLTDVPIKQAAPQHHG